MAASVPVKVQYDGIRRRFNLPVKDKKDYQAYQQLHAITRALVGLSKEAYFEFEYNDEQNEPIRIGSDVELAAAIQHCKGVEVFVRVVLLETAERRPTPQQFFLGSLGMHPFNSVYAAALAKNFDRRVIARNDDGGGPAAPAAAATQTTGTPTATAATETTPTATCSVAVAAELPAVADAATQSAAATATVSTATSTATMPPVVIAAAAAGVSRRSRRRRPRQPTRSPHGLVVPGGRRLRRRLQRGARTAMRTSRQQQQQ
ncbi:hypothetical protein DFJ73DRAFT_902392 [Zopfochytrium polystomum]|nr:hypothetical protein DFJ73DRAFT_902392 [Zopfochytrium polystomum]